MRVDDDDHSIRTMVLYSSTDADGVKGDDCGAADDDDHDADDGDSDEDDNDEVVA